MDQGHFSQLDSDFEASLNLALYHLKAGNLQNTEALCLDLLEHHPDHPQVLLILGTVAQQVGSAEMAEFFLKRGMQFDPGNPIFFNHLSLALQNQEKWEEAILYSQRSVLLVPSSGLAYSILATALAGQQRWIEAVANWHTALNLLDSGSSEYIQAEQKLDQILTDLDSDLELLLNTAEQSARSDYEKGYQLSQKPDHEAQALECLWNALLLKPAYSQAYQLMGIIQSQRKRVYEAIMFYRAALYWDPALASVHYMLGLIFCGLGSWKESEESFQRALQLAPTDIDSIAGYAELMVTVGDIEKARSLIQPLVKTGRYHSRVASVLVSIYQDQGEINKAIDYLKACLAQGSPGTHRSLLFRLGHLFDHQKRYAEAFEAFHKANHLVLQRIKPYDVAQHRQLTSTLIKTFNPDRFQASQDTSHDQKSSSLIFIVGMFRSGTSLTEQILSCHPDVYGGGERQDLPQLVNSLTYHSDPPMPYPECLDHLDQRRIQQIADQYLQKMQALSPGSSRITDKLPTNFFHLGLIALLFPQARIVHCQRHPLDTCLSCYFADFSSVHTHTFDLESLGYYYVEYKQLMHHWGEVLPLPIFTLTYEELVHDPEPNIRALLEFCDLSWSDHCLQFHESSRPVATISNQQVRQPFYTKSVGRYRFYEEQLGTLKQILKQYGYYSE